MRLLNLTDEEGTREAVAAYSPGRPVIVFAAGRKAVLHGEDNLRSIVDTDCPQDCTVLDLPISQEEWDATKWPEAFEAARQLWLKGQGPFRGT